MSRLARRVERELRGGVSLFAEILAMSKRAGVVDLGQGYPDFGGSPAARRAATSALAGESLDAGPLANQYTPPRGHPRLLEAVLAYHRRAHGGGAAAAGSDVEIGACATAGATEAVFAAMQALVDPGDRVLLFEPYWPWYLPCIRMAGGVPIAVRLEAPGWALDARELADVFARERPKLVITNTPHNPTGRVLARGELERVAALCVEHDALAVADDVYENTLFANAEHAALATLPGMAERTLTIGSASKLLSLTGWRVGWCVGPEPLVRGIACAHQHSSVCAPTPLQLGVASALDACRPSGGGGDGAAADGFDGVPAMYARNHASLARALDAIGLEVCDAQGGYFVVARIRPDDERIPGDDVEAVKWLIDSVGVAGMPMRFFYVPADEGSLYSEVPTRLLRFGICKSTSVVDDAVARLDKLRLR